MRLVGKITLAVIAVWVGISALIVAYYGMTDQEVLGTWSHGNSPGGFFGIAFVLFLVVAGCIFGIVRLTK